MQARIHRWTGMLAGLLLLLGSLGIACTGSSSEPAGGAGGATTASGGNVAGTGGRAGSGGTSAGGSLAGAGGGGVASGGVGSGGGVVAVGGNPGSGGAASGGSLGNGGASSGGSSGGGGAASGGGPGSGGGAGSGGSAAGGRAGAGGAATGGSSASGGAAAGGTSGHVGKWQIMPLGDSITETTCYPKLLAQELIAKGHANFEFVGNSLNNQGCGDAANVQTEGHSCYLVSNLVKDVATVAGCSGTKGSLAELKAWAAEKPDVVLLEYGTNDAWSSIATQTILDAFGTVVDQFRLQNPSVIFFIAQITPLNPSGCSTCEANVEALNAKLPSWAAGKSTAASPLYVVNVWASLPAATYTPNSTYTSDGCHPNPAGSQLMADAWYAGLVDKGIP